MEGKVSWNLSKRGLEGPTPKHIARRIDLWTVIFGVLTTSVNSAPFITVEIASSVSWFLGIGIALLQGIKPFYSVEVKGTNVPVENVDVIDTDEKEN